MKCVPSLRVRENLGLLKKTKNQKPESKWVRTEDRVMVPQEDRELGKARAQVAEDLVLVLPETQEQENQEYILC